MVHGDGSAREGVAERGVIDGSATELARLLHGHVPPIPLVQHAVREERSRPHAESLALESSAVAVHVVQPRTVEVPPRHHGAHGEALAAVAVQGVGQELGRAAHGDALAVLELVEAALDAEVALPELAVRGAAGHGAEEVGVDLDHLLHRLRGDVGALRRARVHRDDHAVLEDETEGGGAVVGLDVVHHLALELVVLRAEEGGAWGQIPSEARARSVPGWEYLKMTLARSGGGSGGGGEGRRTRDARCPPGEA